METNEQKSAAQRIIEYLREYGYGSRVALVCVSQEILKYSALDGPHGILTLYHREFAAANPSIQLVHKIGGVVKCYTFSQLRGSNYHLIAGQRFGLIVVETHGTDAQGGLEDETESALIRLSLKLAPREVIRANNGFVYDNFFPEGGEGQREVVALTDPLPAVELPKDLTRKRIEAVRDQFLGPGTWIE